MDPRRTPERIRRGHPADQRPNLWVDLQPSGRSTRLASPVASKPLAVPANDSVGLDDHQDPLPVDPSAPKGDPEGTIEVAQGQPTLRSAVEDRELLPQGQVLQSQLASAFESSGEGTQQDSEQAEHGRRRYSGMAENARQCGADEFPGGTGRAEQAGNVLEGRHRGRGADDPCSGRPPCRPFYRETDPGDGLQGRRRPTRGSAATGAGALRPLKRGFSAVPSERSRHPESRPPPERLSVSGTL